MATELSRIDRLTRTYDLATYFPGGLPTGITAVALALLPPRSNPTAATVWTTATYASGTATVLLAGPDADSTGALVVPASADLWVKVTATPQVDAAKLERVTVLGGGAVLTAPTGVPVVSVNGKTGTAVVLAASDVGAQPVGVGASNGTGDSAAFNAKLASAAAAGRGVVKGLPGETYIIDAPVVLRSNTVLDIRGCALVRKTGYTGRLLTNAAALPLRSIADAAMTATSTTLTSATAAFTSTDVGRAVTVIGAGLPHTGLPYDLYATVVSVTNATTAVLSVAAQTTVSASGLSIYGRDSNIGIVGDAATLIDAGNVAGWTYVNFFRRIDGLSITGGGGICNAYNGGGVVFWSVGDITNYRWDDWTFTHPAGTTPGPGGTQLCGPMSMFSVTNAKGTLQDDMVALQGSNRGWNEVGFNVNDVQGDISDGYIGKLFPRDCRSSAVKIFGGITNANIDTKLRGITVDGVHGDVVLYGVTVESDRAGATNADDIKIRDIRVTTGSGGQPIEIRVGSLTAGNVTIDGVSWTGASGTSGAPRHMIQVAGGLKHLDISRLSLTSGDYVNLVHFEGNSTNIHTVTIDDAYVASGTVGSNIAVVDTSVGVPAIITNLRLNRLGIYGTGKALVNLGSVTNLTPPKTVTPLLPTAIDGLTAWYRADALNLASGAAVASWPDSSPAGNALTQATAGNQPTFTTSAQNGLPGVTFDGSTDVLAAAAGVQAGHVFAVAKYNAATFAGYAGLVTPSTVGPNPILNGKSGAATFDSPFPGVTNAASFYKDGDPYTDITLPGPMNQYAIIEVAALNSAFTNPTTLMVGQDRALAGRYWNGVILEIIVFRKALSANARQSIESYLATKWGTQAILTL